MKKAAGIGIGIAVVAIIGVAFGSTMMGKPGSDFNFGLPSDKDNKMQISDEITVKVNPAQTPSQPTPSVEEPVEETSTQPKTIQVNVSDGVGTSDK